MPSKPSSAAVLAGFAIVLGLALRPAPASSAEAAGTEVVLEVKRVAPPPGKAASPPQYVCAAKLMRPAGEVLTIPRIQTPEGVEASVQTTTDSGVRVAFKVLISAANQLRYELVVTPPGGAPEQHRATISLPL